MSQTAPTLDQISFLDPAIQSDPYPAYRTLRDEAPVFQMPETGFYMVTRYNDVRDVLRDTETFSNDIRVIGSFQGEGGNIQQEMLKERGWEHVQTLQRADPPHHGRYRKLLNQVFTGPRVAQLAPRIQELVNELVDSFIDKGECEFVSEFALPLPGIIIAEQIGLDPKEILTFKKWADAMLATAQRPLTQEEVAEVTETELEAQHYLAKVFEDRRKNPRDDIMSGLVTAEIEGEEPYSMHELQNLMHQLITGGYETTTSALSHGMWLLVQNPKLVEELRSDLSLVDKFVEESLRYKSPVQGLFRQTTRDAKVGDVTIPANSVVIVRYAAANRDESNFDDPDTLDIHRDKLGTHVAFGAGVHRCIGAVLAREELQSAYRVLVSRLGNIELASPMPDHPIEPSIFLFALKKLHIKFDKLA